MTPEKNIKQHLPVNFDIKIDHIMDRNIETRDFSEDSWIVQATFSGRLNPNKGERPPVVTVPIGYGFYWFEAYNAGWTDNINAGLRSLEGFDFENEHQYIYNARRAQLVSFAGDGYVAYEKRFDRNEGGTSYYPNNDGVNWDLYFYLNDRVDYVHDTYDWYDDNAGSANCDIVVFRLPKP